MVSMVNLTAKDLNEIAKKLRNKYNNLETVAVLVTVSELAKNDEENVLEEKIISQAIVPCKEVEI